MPSFVPRVLHYETLPSTNSEVARLAGEGADEGLIVIADEQTAGRGRLQRTWTSPKGAGLYFSLLLRPALPLEQWPLLTFVAALAVNESLRAASGLATDIKWPNDILVEHRKLCGILAETYDTDSGRAIVVGIGINLTSEAYPRELAGVATSVSEETGSIPDSPAIAGALQQSLANWYSRLHENNGAAAIRDAWSARSSYAFGKRIKVSDTHDVFEGTTRGIEADGALRIELPNGELKTIRTGDVVSVRGSHE